MFSRRRSKKQSPESAPGTQQPDATAQLAAAAQLQRLLAQQRTEPTRTGDTGLRGTDFARETERMQREAEQRTRGQHIQRAEGRAYAENRINEMAADAARLLTREGFRPEIKIERESVLAPESEVHSRKGDKIAGSRTLHTAANFRHRWAQKIKQTDTIDGWILTAAHKNVSTKITGPALYRGLALGADGIIYGFTTRGLEDFTVQSKYSGREHQVPSAGHSLSDNPALIHSMQIDANGNYREDPITMDRINISHNFFPGLAPEDYAFADLVHGVGPVEALNNLVDLAKRGAAPMAPPANPPEMPPTSF